MLVTECRLTEDKKIRGLSLISIRSQSYFAVDLIMIHLLLKVLIANSCGIRCADIQVLECCELYWLWFLDANVQFYITFADTVPPTAYITASSSFTNAKNVSVNISFTEPCSSRGGFGCSSVNACNVSRWPTKYINVLTNFILQSCWYTIDSSFINQRAKSLNTLIFLFSCWSMVRAKLYHLLLSLYNEASNILFLWAYHLMFSMGEWYW